MEIVIEKIVQHPMEGLVQYHCVTAPVNTLGQASGGRVK